LGQEREPSWLDEVSFATKFVVVVTVVAIVGFALVRIVELFR
jgi:hypothetical protein